MQIDAHAHLLPPGYVEACRRAGIERPDGMPVWPSWSAPEHLRFMDVNGIDRTLLSVSSPGVHLGDDLNAVRLARDANDATAAVVAEAPERLSWLASLPLPLEQESCSEAERALDNGAVGAVLLTNHAGVYPSDPVLAPLLRLLDDRGAVVLLHPTSPCTGSGALLPQRPAPMLEFLFDTARAVTEMLLAGTVASYPQIRFVVPHSGGVLPLVVDRVDGFRRAFTPEAQGSVRDELSRMWFDVAGTPLPRALPMLAALVGTERLVYGSDYCWTPSPAVEAQVAALTSTAPSGDERTWWDVLARNGQAFLTGAP